MGEGIKSTRSRWNPVDREISPIAVVLGLVAALAILVALSVGGMMLLSRSMMGGMMGGTGTGWGPWDLGVVLASTLVAVAALAFLFRMLPRPNPPTILAMPPPPLGAVPVPSALVPSALDSREESARLERLQEASFVKTLGADERTLYVRIREAGGAVLQRDLVAEGGFSKAKVTRLLDKLERKGLLVRERFGATNRVRLTWKGPQTR
jgi:hypothetical protein